MTDLVLHDSKSVLTLMLHGLHPPQAFHLGISLVNLTYRDLTSNDVTF